jgi:hypothetical protein
MKKLLFSSFIIFSFSLIFSDGILAQNLQFNQAIFNTYGPGNADGINTTPMFTGTLIVASGQVLKVTSTGCSSVNASNAAFTNLGSGALTINDIVFNLSTGSDFWLPTGTYTIKGYELNSYTGGSFKGWITGVLYDIIP